MIGGFIALISFLILVSIGLTAVSGHSADRASGVDGDHRRSMAGPVERIAYRPAAATRSGSRRCCRRSACHFVLTNYSQIAQGARVKPIPADHHRRLYPA